MVVIQAQIQLCDHTRHTVPGDKIELATSEHEELNVLNNFRLKSHI